MLSVAERFGVIAPVGRVEDPINGEQRLSKTDDACIVVVGELFQSALGGATHARSVAGTSGREECQGGERGRPDDGDSRARELDGHWPEVGVEHEHEEPQA